MGVQAQGMVGNGKTFCLCDGFLTVFNRLIKKFLHFAAIQTDEVVVVMAFIELIDRPAAIKTAARQDTGLLKLEQDTVDGRQANVGVLQQQDAEHIFRRHVARLTLLENLQDLQSGQGRFEACAFKFVYGGHEGALFGRIIRAAQPLQ
jgi:hypothetical protein